MNPVLGASSPDHASGGDQADREMRAAAGVFATPVASGETR